MSRTVRRLALAGGASVLTLAFAGAAAASVPAPLTTSNGEAGYGAVSATSLTNIQAVVTPDQYGTTITGGAIGVQLAAQKGSGCYAAQLGLVASTSTSTYSVEYGTGTVTGTCPAVGVVSGTQLGTLTDLPDNGSVYLSLSYVTTGHTYCWSVPWGHQGQWGHHQECWSDHSGDGLLAAAENLDTSSPVLVTKWFTDPATFTFGSFGISLDNSRALTPATAGLAEPAAQDALGAFTDDTNSYTSYADQQVAEFDYASLTQHGGSPELIDGTGLTPNEAQYVSGGDVVADMHDSLTDDATFPLGAPSEVSSYLPSSVKGAGTLGNSFQIFTGNSIAG
jgi:hypothetical protein